VSCPLHEILKQTGERVVEFVSSVDHFSATETMNHEALTNLVSQYILRGADLIISSPFRNSGPASTMSRSSAMG